MNAVKYNPQSDHFLCNECHMPMVWFRPGKILECSNRKCRHCVDAQLVDLAEARDTRIAYLESLLAAEMALDVKVAQGWERHEAAMAAGQAVIVPVSLRARLAGLFNGQRFGFAS